MKNKLLKSIVVLTTSATAASILLPCLSSCAKQTAKITITNKINVLNWLTRNYVVRTTFDNPGQAKVLFSSSNESVATIDENGRIHAVDTGTTTIRAYSSMDPNVGDQFDVTLTNLFLNGFVKDDQNKPLAGVNVSCSGATVITDETGKYEIDVKRPNDVIYFEKIGYISQALGNSYNLVSTQHRMDITLHTYIQGVGVEVSGVVKDVAGNPLKNTCVCFNKESLLYKICAYTDNEGKYSTKVFVDPQKPTVTFVANNAEYDYDEKIITIDNVQSGKATVNVTVNPYQYDIQVYVNDASPNEKIIGHIYRNYAKDVQDATVNGLLVKLQANFSSAFTEEKQYSLIVNTSKSLSKPKVDDPIYGNNFQITFDSKKVISTKGPVTIPGIDIIYDIDTQTLSLFVPDSNMPENLPEVIGFYLQSADGKFAPFLHEEFSNPNNELCYVRVDKNNHLFAASDNVNPFDLTWDTPSGEDWVVSDTLGWIGLQYYFGYKVKIAKYKGSDHPKGLYIMTKYGQDQMSDHLPDKYNTHFFFDPVQLVNGKYPTRAIDPKVKHINTSSGYWLQRCIVKDSEHSDVEIFQYDKVFKEELEESPKMYSINDFVITYIPYSEFNYEDEQGNTVEFNENSTFGFCCNLQYRYSSENWQGWNDPNPSGYRNPPRYPDLTSYVQLDKDLKVIRYNW